MEKVFLVTLELPRGVTVEDMREYIEDAICSYKGGMDPEEPVTDLENESIVVKALG